MGDLCNTTSEDEPRLFQLSNQINYLPKYLGSYLSKGDWIQVFKKIFWTILFQLGSHPSSGQPKNVWKNL